MQIIKSHSLKKNIQTPKIFEKSLLKDVDQAADWYTIFVSSIRVSNNKVIFVGPPLRNFEEHIQFYDGDIKLKHHVHNSKKYSRVSVNTSSDIINLKFNGEEFCIKILDRSEKFKDEIMISTMLCDEPMCWISEWIQYHYVTHKIKSTLR